MGEGVRAALKDILAEEKHFGLFPKGKLTVLKLQRKCTPDLVIHMS